MPEPKFEGQNQEENLPPLIELKTDEQKRQEEKQRINRELFGDVNVDKITEHLCGKVDIGTVYERVDKFSEIIFIESEIAHRFPNTYQKTPEDNLEKAKEVVSKPLHKGFLHSKHRSIALYELATFSKGDAIDEKDINALEAQLKDKKILILGDDTGSFSEILIHLAQKL